MLLVILFRPAGIGSLWSGWFKQRAVASKAATPASAQASPGGHT